MKGNRFKVIVPKMDDRKNQISFITWKFEISIFCVFIYLCFFSSPLWSISRESLKYPSPQSEKPSILLSLRQIWVKEFDARFSSSPVIAKNQIIILHASGRLEALDLKEGTSQWEKGPLKEGTILGAGEGVILLKSGTTLMGVKAEDGEIIWRSNPYSQMMSWSRVKSKSFVLLMDNILYRLNLLEGTLNELGHIKLSLGQGAPFAFDGRRYLALVQNSRFVVLYDLKKNKVKWRFQSGSKITQAPILEEKTLYILSEDHFIYALKLKNGHQLFRKKMANKLRYPAAKSKGILFLSPFASKSLYMVDMPTGSSQTLFSLDSERYHFIDSPSCHEDYLAATYSDYFSDKYFLVVFAIEEKLDKEKDMLQSP